MNEDPIFSGLDLNELEDLIALLTEGETDAARAAERWRELDETTRAKFSHCIVQHEREGAH